MSLTPANPRPRRRSPCSISQLANLAQLPPTDADKAWLRRISDLLRQQLADSGRYEIVSLTGKVKQEVAKAAPLRDCGGRAVDVAKEVGADAAVTGKVQKVSDLILNINVYMKKVASKAPRRRLASTSAATTATPSISASSVW